MTGTSCFQEAWLKPEVYTYQAPNLSQGWLC